MNRLFSLLEGTAEAAVLNKEDVIAKLQSGYRLAHRQRMGKGAFMLAGPDMPEMEVAKEIVDELIANGTVEKAGEVPMGGDVVMVNYKLSVVEEFRFPEQVRLDESRSRPRGDKESAKAHYKKLMAKYKAQPIDKKEYPPIRGMEGPFRINGKMEFPHGKVRNPVVYYDPKEGQYYDRKSDMYAVTGLIESHSLVERIDFVMEREDPNSVGKQVARAGKLDDIDPHLAKVIVQGGLLDGDKKDDKIAVSKKTWKASDLKPSQTSMVLEKSVAMALHMIETGKIGGDLGAIVSSDNHIMDGHHRWAATILASGKSGKVGGFGADLKGDKLLKVLNLLTKGLFHRKEGKPGSGKLSEFTPEKTKAALEKMVKRGIGGEHPKQAAVVKKNLEDGFGSVGEGIKQMSENAKLITKKVPSWAPDRKQMPVIEPKEVSKAAKVMKGGKVDHTEPHHD